MKDYAQFHQHLLGIDPERTPKEFRITPLQRRLYTEANEGKHGGLMHQKDLRDWDHFLGSFVIAYAQTTEGQVFFTVSAAVHKWVNEQVKIVARHIFSTRQKTPRPKLVLLFESFQNLSIGSNVLQIGEPPRWVAYGFSEKDILPPWMRGKLSVLKTKAESACDEQRAD